MITEEDIRAIRAVVKDEMDKMRMKVSEVSGRGGHTVISSRGDIILQPGNGCRALYHDTEIGSGTGGGSGDVLANATRATGTLTKWTNGSGKEIGNSLLSESGTIISSTATINMIAGKSTQYYELNGHLAGYIQGIYTTSQEVIDNLGILIQGKYHSGGNPPTIYAGDSGDIDVMGPVGSGSYGIHLTEVGIGIKPDATKDIFLITSGGGKAYYNGTEISGGAPSDAKYIVQQANATLTAAQALSILETGILKNTTTTGVLSIADVTIDTLPSQASASGKYLKSNGTIASWETGGVTSVFGRTGAVTYDNADYPNYPLLDGTRAFTGAVAMSGNNITGTGDVLPHDSGSHYCGDDTHHWLSLYSRTVNIPYSAGVSTAIYTDSSGNMILYSSGEILKIGSSLMTAMTPLTMNSTNRINFSDTNTYIGRSSSNLDIGAGGSWKIAATSTSVDLSIKLLSHEIYFKKNHTAEDCAIVDDANGTMEFHVPTGQVFSFIVG